MTTPNICAKGFAIGRALENGHLWAMVCNGRFSIPVKAGLKNCIRITETDDVTIDGVGGNFIVSSHDPNKGEAI